MEVEWQVTLTAWDQVVYDLGPIDQLLDNLGPRDQVVNILIRRNQQVSELDPRDREEVSDVGLKRLQVGGWPWLGCPSISSCRRWANTVAQAGACGATHPPRPAGVWPLGTRLQSTDAVLTTRIKFIWLIMLIAMIIPFVRTRHFAKKKNQFKFK